MCYGISTSMSASVHFLYTGNPGVTLNELILTCPEFSFWQEEDVCSVATLSFLLLVTCCFTQFMIPPEEGWNFSWEIPTVWGSVWTSWARVMRSWARRKKYVFLLSISQMCPFKNPLEWGGGQEKGKQHIRWGMKGFWIFHETVIWWMNGNRLARKA